MVIVLVTYDSLAIAACVHRKLAAFAGPLWGEGIEVHVRCPLHPLRIYTVEPRSQAAVFGVTSVGMRCPESQGHSRP